MPNAGGEDRAHGEPDKHEGGEHVGGVAAAGADPGEQQHRHDPERHAGDRRLPWAPMRGSTRVCTVVAVDDDRCGHRQEGEAGSERREAESLLQVEGEEQEHPEDARHRERDRGIGAAAGAVPDDVQRQQRMRRAALDQDEGASSTTLATSETIVSGALQEWVSALENAEHQREQPGRGGQRAREVDPGSVRVGPG